MSDISLPWERTVVLTFAVEIGALALVLLATAFVMRRRGRAAFGARLLVSSGLAGAMALVAAAAAYTVAPTLPTPYVPFTAQFRTNPVPNTPENVAAGRILFQQNCVVCHGARGLGDGPAAFAMNPRPVNLQLHVPQHPDGFIEYWIAEGVPGTQMPAWKDKLDETQRWQVLLYLRELAAGRP